jgi:hypothetical protein
VPVNNFPYAPAVIAAVRLAVVLALLVAAPAAQAQDTGTYSSPPLDPGADVGRAWVDFNADGKADFCRVLGGGLTATIACTVSTGAGFGATYTYATDGGYADGRMWGDVSGDGRADYCRRVGNGGADSRIGCSISTGTGFTDGGNTLQAWGANETLADANGDGTADYCRITGADPNYAASCSPNAADSPSSIAANPGSAYGRAWADVNGDGKADFCRVISVLVCSTANGSISSNTVDLGYEPGRAWADVNGDRLADYCARVGNGGADARMGCVLSTGSGFGQFVVSAPLEWGDDAAYAWVDFEGDGDRDFCRAVAPTPTNQQLFCTLWPGLTTTIVSGPTDLGAASGRAWVDHNGDGRADFCRVTGSTATCTISNGTGFGPLPPAPPPVAAPPPAPAPKKTRIVVTLAYDYRTKGRYTRLTRLVVNRVPRGATVKATCKKGCSRKRYTKKNVRGGKLSLKKLVRKRLKAGTKIRVVVSQSGKLSATKTLRIRSGKRPLVR